MSFRQLYDFVQTKNTLPIDLAELGSEIGRIIRPYGRGVSIRTVDFNPKISRGFYLSSRNEDTVMYKGVPLGNAVVVLSEGLNYCWTRYVQLKELMHIFDDPLDSTNSDNDLETLLFGLCEDVKEGRSRQLKSEHECLWMALALFCPEPLRVQLQQQRDAQTITDHDIAEMLKIPERVVVGLFLPGYKDNIAYLLEKIRFHVQASPER